MAAKTSELLSTPLQQEHVDLGGRMVAFAGYSMPIRYGSQVEEHHAVRKAAGLFDVSHMGQLLAQAPDIVARLEQLLPIDVEAMAIGGQRYCLLTNDKGGIRDDLIVTRQDDTKFLLVVLITQCEMLN